MNENVPARQAMAFYFNEKSHKGRQGNFCTIASVLSDAYTAACNKSNILNACADKTENTKVGQLYCDVPAYGC
jgi:hypothetical protein